MQEMRNCNRCGRLFNYTGLSTVCSQCFAQDEAEFSRIKEYLYEHPFAKIFEVSTNLNIPVNKLKRYLREGRLEIVEPTNLFLDCEICGRPIRSGKYCDDCYKQANHDFKVIYTGNSNTSKSHSIQYRSSNGSKAKKVATR